MSTLGVSIFGISLVVAVAATALMKYLAPRFGIMDHPDERRVHQEPTPKGGGIGVFLGTLLPVAAGLAVVHLHPLTSRYLPEAVKSEIPRLLKRTQPLVAIFAGGALLVLLGLMDDLRGLSVKLRLVVEFAIAGALYYFARDVRVTFFSPFPFVWIAMTCLWIVGITNSFNLLDNMDGLSGGVAFIVSGAVLWVAVTSQQFLVAALLLAFMGALAGFLVFNFPPASIFMGDAGSLFLGYFVAVVTMTCTFSSYSRGDIVAATMPLLFLAVPLYDTASVVWIRIRNRKPVWGADKNHLSHRLVALGFSPRDAVFTIYLLTFCCSAAATLIPKLDRTGTAVVLLLVFGFLLLIALIERAGRKVVQKHERRVMSDE